MFPFSPNLEGFTNICHVYHSCASLVSLLTNVEWNFVHNASLLASYINKLKIRDLVIVFCLCIVFIFSST